MSSGNENNIHNHSPPPPYSAPQPLGFEGKVPPSSDGGYPGLSGTQQQFASGPPQYVPATTNNPLPPPPQPQHVGGVHSPQQIVVSATTASFGPFPVEMDCPYCQNHIVTHNKQVPGMLAWIIFVVCFVLGFFLLFPWCLCCIPFCVDSCLDVMHYCPACKRVVGKFARL